MAPSAPALAPRVRAFLEAPRYAVLATVNPDGSPHLTEMWFALRGDLVIFNTTDDRTKRRNVERDPRVSLLVAGIAGEPAWRPNAYVRVAGTVREIARGAQAQADIHALAVRYDGPEEAARMVREVWSKQQRVTYALTIGRVYVKGLPG